MKVEKVINNNLVRSSNERGQEVLVMGCGLGFKKKPGDAIDDALIEKVYVAGDRASTNRLTELLDKVPLEHIQLTNEIVRYANLSLNKPIGDQIYLSLTDHISFAIERAQKGIPVRNALLWEIRRFYNHEFLIGKEALEMIRRRTGVELPEDEAGFIALHLVNASMDAPDMGKTTEMTRVIQSILTIVKYHFQVELDEYSLHYERFLTHLKFFVQRLFRGAEIDDEDKSFLQVLKEQFQNEYRCALKIRDYVRKEFGKELTEDELVYLTVHIKRVTTK